MLFKFNSYYLNLITIWIESVWKFKLHDFWPHKYWGWVQLVSIVAYISDSDIECILCISPTPSTFGLIIPAICEWSRNRRCFKNHSWLGISGVWIGMVLIWRTNIFFENYTVRSSKNGRRYFVYLWINSCVII